MKSPRMRRAARCGSDRKRAGLRGPWVGEKGADAGADEERVVVVVVSPCAARQAVRVRKKEGIARANAVLDQAVAERRRKATR